MTTIQKTDAEIVLGNIPWIGMGNGFQRKLKTVTIPYDPNDKDYGDPEPKHDFSYIWEMNDE